MEVSDTSKIVGPSPLRSQLIRNHDHKNECFLTTFWEKMVCFTKLTPRTPPSVIHGWKATDLLYEMVRRKNYWQNPISRQNFANALAENHNLKLEVCHITYWPAGGRRGQNPCRTGLAQGLDLCLKYGPRALCSQFYMSQGMLYVPREVDLADKTRVAATPIL